MRAQLERGARAERNQFSSVVPTVIMSVRSIIVCVVLLTVARNGLSSFPELFDKIHYRDDADENPCEEVKVLPRIVGGSQVVSKTTTPYIVAVGERLSNGSLTWYCGGSLLSGYFVLTAAHCLTSRNTDVVRVGSLSLNKRDGKNDYSVSQTFIHPKYKPPKSYHDLAILRVKERIRFTDNVKPICLAERNQKYNGKTAKVIGWGAEEVGGDGSQKLKKVQVEIVNNTQCDSAYQNSTISMRSFPEGVKDSQLCAGSSRGGKDACQGDSGGPLVISGDDGITRQIGIVSTGAGCGARAYPGVYTRVSTYYKWIQKTIAEPTPTKMFVVASVERFK